MSKSTVFGIWLIIILAFWWGTRALDINFNALLNNYLKFLVESPLSPIIMLLLFMIRPLLLLPSTILIGAMGFLYGAFWGFIYGQVAIIASSSLAYLIGRYFSKNINFEGRYSKFFENMQGRSFESILLSRLIFLPGDLINYGAGFLKINYWGFLLGTLIGGAPGMLIVIFAGSAIEGDFTTNKLIIRKDYLLVSTALLLFSLALAWWLRTKQKRTQFDSDGNSD